MTKSQVLAGPLADLGDSLIATLTRWGSNGLEAALVLIVVSTLVTRVSLKAGIGALIGLVVALGIYHSRFDLADLFEDEVKNPAKSAPAFAPTHQPLPGARVIGEDL
ncbi:hypothetical protein [Streptomyces sp. NPDC002952]|jgi:hypothetical protein|uniref:hypothetical protein n=1 Tax=Streptomyces sp. NPDC002952 TaxID=3364673 RepID=UPI0036B32D70